MLFLLHLLACDPVPYGNSCRQYVKLRCETCDLVDFEKSECTCLENGTLTADDMPESEDMTNDEAVIYCDQFLAALNYPGPGTAASCKRSLEFFQKYEKDACPVTPDPTTTYDPSDSG